MHSTTSDLERKPSPRRLEAVDAVRGLAMVLMALDHTREFLPTVTHDPLDPDKTTLALFMTRWITHFCAPVFAFLAGMAVGLSQRRGRSAPELSRFLLRRGSWLILLECTVVGWLGWDFWINPRAYSLQVIWMLGVSLIVLAGLIRLPRGAIAVIALIQILGHDLLDPVKPESLGPVWGDLWRLFHVQGLLAAPQAIGVSVWAFYPLVPWVGVVAAGYLAAPLMSLEPGPRRRWFAWLGIGSLVVFVLLRGTNLYGDPEAWTTRATPMRSVLSFLNCQKYPPSLGFLLMTLGPMFILLALLDRRVPAPWRGLAVFGRVPLFYYLVHVPLIHAMAVATCLLTGRDASLQFGYSLISDWLDKAVANYHYPLALTYLLWLLALAILYPLCRRFGEWKRSRTEEWVRYL